MKVKRNFQVDCRNSKKKVGKKQTIETLINEEALLLAKFLRNERKDWKPRMLSIES
jgi:hypothetical protein